MQTVCNPPTIEEEAYYYDLKLTLYNDSPIKEVKSTSHPDLEIKQINGN